MNYDNGQRGSGLDLTSEMNNKQQTAVEALLAIAGTEREGCAKTLTDGKMRTEPSTITGISHVHTNKAIALMPSSSQSLTILARKSPRPWPSKSFTKMSANERKEYWSDNEKLLEFFRTVTGMLDGDKCSVCEFPPDQSIDKRCDKCGVFSHADCADPARGERATCLTCRFIEESSHDANYEVPRCHMCCHPNSVGPLVRAKAHPVSMKKWKLNMASFQRSTFGKNKFCHALCGLWNPECQAIVGLDTTIDCSNIALSNGRGFVGHHQRCTLSGLHRGAKVKCHFDGCEGPVGLKKKAMYHVTCARQAGLEVKHDGDFTMKCFMHVDCSFVFRARLEDLKEIELNRLSTRVFKPYIPMTWIHASSLLHASVAIMRTLGWAWRWAEWWVASGDNWEPLIEPGQVEEDMTEEELKIVHSTDESRCRDARQCRLAAFGAALRNRDYDKEAGDDQEPLERALTAVLSTKSLVGPLKKKEIDFFVTWLALAYRSKSPALGLGDDKTPVATDSFCVHQDDGTPKYELGSRPLPGKSESEKGVFEPPVLEVDDFLKAPLPSPTKKVVKRRNFIVCDLGFGDDKAPVATDSFCVHQDDGTPKYELGTRPLPGKSEPEKGAFEPPVIEVDDFLKATRPSPANNVKKQKKNIDLMTATDQTQYSITSPLL